MSRLLPLIAFVAMAFLLWIGLGNADRKTIIPSPLIDKPAPAFNLPVLGQTDRSVSRADLEGQIYLLNVWASWCYACRIEHQTITDLANSGLVPVYGLNWKDDSSDAQAWLARFGDPYKLSLADISGRTGIDFGVYGAPESFVIDGEGKIRYKYIGPLNEDIVSQEIIPIVEQINAENNANDNG